MADASKSEELLNEILKYANAREAFDRLIADGLDRDRAKFWVLWLQEYRPFRTTKSARFLANRKAYRKLAEKFSALAAEIESLRVDYWPSIRPAKTEDRSTQFDGEFFRPEELCSQLRTGAEYFALLGNHPNFLLYILDMTDYWLLRMVEEVDQCTRTEHYDQICLLLEAATSGQCVLDTNALRERMYRARKKFPTGVSVISRIT